MFPKGIWHCPCEQHSRCEAAANVRREEGVCRQTRGRKYTGPNPRNVARPRVSAALRSTAPVAFQNRVTRRGHLSLILISDAWCAGKSRCKGVLTWYGEESGRESSWLPASSWGRFLAPRVRVLDRTQRQLRRRRVGQLCSAATCPVTPVFNSSRSRKASTTLSMLHFRTTAAGAFSSLSVEVSSGLSSLMER